ncbi:MAG: hypothetical protein JO308_04160 [Verrucomicrobia bacterium]|nr:hypothetical protein [Verrucomicrobiota bacterium]
MIHWIKVTLARREAAEIESCARRWRRKFRDYRRIEGDRIRQAEIRARGLRLYAAWANHSQGEVVPASTLLTWTGNPAFSEIND